MIAEPSQFRLPQGARPPPFKLPGVDGKTWSLDDFRGASALVVVFSCNHCPYVQGTEDRLIAAAREYGARGVRFVLVNSNETVNYPTDDVPHMVERARQKGYPFPYLRDESQDVARAYGALVTPHFFVFDRDLRLAYQGAFDDSPKDPSAVQRNFLRDALEDILSGKRPAADRAPVQGCSVKWAV
ncbi:MAG TPA: thioredoxin family protein [Candidatus Thermoplasmatota archaeon]|nr:thioredoxin family protein [Candidatus Thermoplasmatota archaeon]